MKRIFKIFIAVVVCLLFCVNNLYAAGLRTRFVEVKLNNLTPGNTYSVKELTKRTLLVENVARNAVVDIEITAEKPVSRNLTRGYEPLPDLSWVKIEKNYFEKIGPGCSVETDIYVTIPSGKEYYGKKYQVYLYSHTVGKTVYKVGLMSRILIDVAKK